MIASPTNYPNLLAAAGGLLGHTVELVTRTGLNFAVIGGWSPYLLNRGVIQHPGTRDVDILFEEGATKGILEQVVKELAGAGFVHSAKHEFQLLYQLTVGGIDFVFNVDLLHASEARKNPDLFVDHVSLPVRLSEFSKKMIPARSIVVPISQFIFKGHVVKETFSFMSPNDGKQRQIVVPLMDELGTMVTKAESMSLTKRSRDAFDIFLAVQQARNLTNLRDGMKQLRSDLPEAFDELTKLRALVSQPKHRENISNHWSAALGDRDWSLFAEKFAGLLNDAGVPRANKQGDAKDTA